MTEIGRYLLSLFITPRVRDILFAIFDVRAFQLMYSFIVIPQKLNVVTLSIFVSQIIKYGISFAVRSELIIDAMSVSERSFRKLYMAVSFAVRT